MKCCTNLCCIPRFQLVSIEKSLGVTVVHQLGFGRVLLLDGAGHSVQLQLLLIQLKQKATLEIKYNSKLSICKKSDTMKVEKTFLAFRVYKD